MKKRFLLLLLLCIISISLSSCSLLDDFLNELSVESYSGTTTKRTTDKNDTEYPVITTTDTISDTSINTTRPNTNSSSSETSYITYTYTSSVINNEFYYGYLDLDQYENKEALKALYSNLYNKLFEFSYDFNDVKSSTIDSTRVYQIIDIEFFAQYGLNENEAFSVLKLVELDHPEFYFISNEVRIATKTVNETAQEKTLLIYVDPDYYKGSVREEYSQNIELFFYNATLLLEEEDTELTIIRKVHDYIIDNATYAFKKDGKTPSDSANAHNIVGITSEGEGVCESYAELFTYILNRLGIRCITVTGYGYTSDTDYEAHAWNYVKIDDSYYAFDLTWDDSTNSMDYYGLSSSILDDHIPSESVGVLESRLEYLYILPELSTNNLEY